MSFKPPQSAINNAKRGLKLRQEWGRGGLSPAEAKAQGIDSGVTRARKISSGTVSEHDVRRMSAFNRHRKNYRPDKKMPDGGPTAGTIAWLLWGGTSGVNWAKKKSAAMNAEDEKKTTTFTDGNWEIELYTDFTIEEHRKLAKPHNEHYDYLKYLETTSDSRVKTFKEWLMSEMDWDAETFASDEFTEEETLEELYEDYLEELDTYGHDGPVMSKSEYGRYLSDMEDKTFDAESWSPKKSMKQWMQHEEQTEEEVTWDYFHANLYPPNKLLTKIWTFEGKPNGSVEAWWNTITNQDDDEQLEQLEEVFERHYPLILKSARKNVQQLIEEHNWYDMMSAETFEAEKCICKNYTPDFNRQKPMTTDDEEEQAVIVPITCDDCGRKGQTVYLYGYNEYDDSNLKWFEAETFEAEDPDDPELLDYMVSVPVLHHYTVGPVEAYNPEDAEDEVVDNWRYWRSTIDNNGDWGGPIWRYRGIDISEPEAYFPTEYEAEYKTMRKDEIGQLVNATKATLDALNDCLEEDGRFNEDEYDALWSAHPILADLQSKRFAASGQVMPVGFEETNDYYEEGAHIIEAQIPFLAPKGYYISDIEFHDGRIEVIFISEDKTFEADWRDLPRDSKGRWMPQGRPEGEPKVSTYSRKPITLRELSEQLQQDLGLEDFNTAYFTVQQMLDAFPGGDSDEARRALSNTIEDTRMVLEYNEEVDYPTHLQIMTDIYREQGTMPPAEYEDAVFNRIAFEDEFASDYYEHPMSNMPYGHSRQEEYQEMLEEWDLDGDPPSFEEWLEQEEEYDRQLQEYEGSKEYERAMEDWEKQMQEDYEMQQKSASESFNAERRLKPNLPITSPDYTYSETFGKNIVLLSEDDEDEGPTVEDFFREAEKLFNKYGEFSWDSEQHDDGLAINCFLVPWNGAYNFFQYDEDFSQYRDE